MTDFRFAARLLLKYRGFTAVAVLTLAVGIGANSAIFSVIKAALLKPLPYREPCQLIVIQKNTAPRDELTPGGGDLVSDREYLAWRRQNQTLDSLAAWAGSAVNLSGRGDAERVTCADVSESFLPLLGIAPQLGRLFTLAEDAPGAAPVVLLSHGLWRRRFGGQPSVLGETLNLDGELHSIVGVLPASFQFPEPFDLWRPLRLSEAAAEMPEGMVSLRLLRVVGRLKSGTALATAQAELEVIQGRLFPVSPGPDAGPRMRPFLPGGPDAALPVPSPLSEDAMLFAADPAPPPPGSEPAGAVDALVSPPSRSFPAGSRPGDAVAEDRFEAVPPGAIPFSVASPLPSMLGLGLGGRVRLVPLHERITANARPALFVLSGAVGLVLLIACANVANLLLARAGARRREMAVRVALGASRVRLVRQVLVESLLLALAGSVLGLLLAAAGVGGLPLAASNQMPQLNPVAIDGWVLLFTGGVALATSVLFGLVPALQASAPEPHTALKDGGQHTVGPSSGRARRGLVAGEVALAIVLLAGAGLLLRSFASLRAVRPGFEAAGLLTTTIQLTPASYREPSRQRAFFVTVLERLRTLPGVQAVGATDHLPLTDYSVLMALQVEGRERPRDPRGEAVSGAAVTPDYFRAMGIPLKAGRTFTDADDAASPAVVLVNETFVRRFLDGGDAMGRGITAPSAAGGWAAIVGVVGDVRQSGLDQEIVPEVYWPMNQQPSPLMTVVLRTGGDPARLATAVQAAVREVDAAQPLQALLTMEQRLASTLVPRRTLLLLLAVFAGVAVFLAAVGLYGVMTGTVQQRRREIGVRVALGARRRDIVELVFREGLAAVVLGILAGIAGALILTRSLSSMLFGIAPHDPVTLGGVAVLLLGVAAAACGLPARRAAALNPLEALRHE